MVNHSHLSWQCCCRSAEAEQLGRPLKVAMAASLRSGNQGLELCEG